MDKLREHMAVLIGVVAIAPYGIVRFALAGRVRIAAEEWAQYTYLLKGVEAIALAAVGFLFGKAVNLMRAEAAEGRAKDAQQQLEKVRARNTAGAAQVEALAALAKRKGTRAKLLETGHRERTQLGPTRSRIYWCLRGRAVNRY
jgi:hypothetical protein